VGKWGQIPPEKLFQNQKKENLCVVFSLSLNRFKGNEYLQLAVEKISVGDLI
jgi:hypothetical protein